MALILGVDGGNTKSIALVAQPDGTIIGAGRSGCTDIYGAASPAAAMAELERALDAALAQADSARSAITTACFSLAGADWPEDYAYLTAQITARGLASDFVVANDALGSLRAGVLDGVGVVAACGTGFATAARNAAGDFWHGSFWLEGLGGIELGRMALRAVVRAELGIEPPTALTAPLVAHFQQPDTESVLRLFTLNGQPHPTENDLSRLAPLVLRSAAEGDAAARAIIRYHAEHVLDYALVAARKVGLTDQPFTLVLNGGIFRDAGGTLLAALRDACSRRAPQITLVRGRYEPAVGALLHAFDRAGYPLDAERIGRIEASVPPVAFFATHT